MVSTRTARILRIARPTPRTEATPPSGGQHGPRRRAPRTPAGRVALTIEVDLERLPRPPHTGSGSTVDASSPDAREEEPDTHDHPAALDVLRHLYSRARRRQDRFARDLHTQMQFLLRSRAGALVHAVVGRPARDAPALKSLEDLHTYRTIMGAWMWTSLFQAVRDTRSYETGLDAGLLLLRAADHHHAQLSRREAVAHRKQLYWFVLATLDWLDEWDLYLETWEAIRARTAYALSAPLWTLPHLWTSAKSADAHKVLGTLRVPQVPFNNSCRLTLQNATHSPSGENTGQHASSVPGTGGAITGNCRRSRCYPR